MPFFEPPPPEDVPPDPSRRPRPAWQAPPETYFPGVLPYQQTIARAASAIVMLIDLHAYPQGCLFELTAVARRPEPDNDPWPQQDQAGINMISAPRPGWPLSPELLRFGVALPDGRTATTIESDRRHRPDAEQPAPPVLIGVHGVGSAADERLLHYQQPLWLWPAPPPETFELVVEWPAYGITETRAPIDGAAIAEAATHSAPYWPDLL